MIPHKILYIITLSELGGAQSHVLELIKGFHAHSDVHLATSAPGPLTKAAEALGIAVHLLPSLAHAISPLNDVRAVRECLDLIRVVRPQLIHVHSSKAGLIGRVAATIAHVPVVFTAHGWGFAPGVPPAQRYLVWLSEVMAAGLSDGIVCVSDYDKALAEKKLFRNKRQLFTIYNGLHSQATRATPDSEPVDIIMTARFQRPKDHQLLLRAFAAAERPDARLTLVGGGPELPACHALAGDLGIAARVDFLGDRADVASLLAQSQIFVLASRQEGLPISILEAMRAGLPVIASDVGGIREEVEHDVTGFLVPSGDIRALSSVLATLIDDRQARRRMGDAGCAKFLREFAAERMLAQLESLYGRILAGSGLSERVS